MIHPAYLIGPALLPALLSCAALAPLRAEEPPRPPSGEARLASGRVVHYTIHFDRNSLQDSLRIGDGLIALTSAGTLLRFELPDVRLVRECISTVDVTVVRNQNAFSVIRKRFDKNKGRWETVLRLPAREGPVSLEPLNTNGPRWYLLDPYQHRLWRLDHGAPKENPRLTRVAINSGQRPIDIHAAIPWADDAFLLATDSGLMTFSPATGKAVAAGLPEPARVVTTLVRDRLGRLWLGNEKGLWLSEPGAKSVEAFDRVPWLAQGGVEGLTPDPAHADGIIAALGRRGVAFVRAEKKP